MPATKTTYSPAMWNLMARAITAGGKLEITTGPDRRTAESCATRGLGKIAPKRGSFRVSPLGYQLAAEQWAAAQPMLVEL